MSSESVKSDPLNVGWDHLLRLPAAVLIGVVIVLIGGLFKLFGYGDKINIGGILGEIMKQPTGKDPIDVANSVPEDRTNAKGEDVAKETTGPEGFEQQRVKVIDDSRGFFRDRQKIRVEGSNGVETIQLPKGVQDKDVHKVYEIIPGEFRVVSSSTPDQQVTDNDISVLEDKLGGS
jgi:hypothetical protein